MTEYKLPIGPIICPECGGYCTYARDGAGSTIWLRCSQCGKEWHDPWISEACAKDSQLVGAVSGLVTKIGIEATTTWYQRLFTRVRQRLAKQHRVFEA